jgi:hypothetical protein
VCESSAGTGERFGDVVPGIDMTATAGLDDGQGGGIGGAALLVAGAETQAAGDHGDAQGALGLIVRCALTRRVDHLGANPARQLSLQPEAPGADQEATNGLKHFGNASLWEAADPAGRNASEH